MKVLLFVDISETQFTPIYEMLAPFSGERRFPPFALRLVRRGPFESTTLDDEHEDNSMAELAETEKHVIACIQALYAQTDQAKSADRWLKVCQV